MEAHVHRAPGPRCGGLYDPRAKGFYLFVFPFDVVYGKRQADVLVPVVLRRPVVVDRQRGLL